MTVAAYRFSLKRPPIPFSGFCIAIGMHKRHIMKASDQRGNQQRMKRKAPYQWPPVPIESIQLMGAVAEPISLDDARFVYEPKYDGVRVKAEVQVQPIGNAINIWSRTGNIITGQFPDVVQAFQTFQQHLTDSIVVDGEIVATSQDGTPLKFQDLQPRLGVVRPTQHGMTRTPVVLFAFDVCSSVIPICVSSRSCPGVANWSGFLPRRDLTPSGSASLCMVTDGNSMLR
jgi:hypothetical protein